MDWVRRVPLGPIAAVLLGLASAFVAWAIPAHLLGALMRHLHVTSVLPAAAPPYSETTRVALAVLGGVVAGVAVLLGFRRIEGERPAARPLPEADADKPPVLRRGDRHPDAPARRPLFAAELLLDTSFADEAAPEPPAPAAEPVRAVAEALATELQPDPVPTPEPAPVEPAIEAPPPLTTAVADPPKLVAPQARLVTGSVAELMARLEAGLARRAAPAPQPVAGADPLPLGDALREALADLQQMARR